MGKCVIGEAAEEVWYELRKNGKRSTTSLENSMDIEASLIRMAIGWLACEGKVFIRGDGGQIAVTLAHGKAYPAGGDLEKTEKGMALKQFG